MNETNAIIRRAFQIAEDLRLLADQGDGARTDDGCGVLFGVMRDCAYHIRAQAERERDEHKLRGEWSVEADTSATHGGSPADAAS